MLLKQRVTSNIFVLGVSTINPTSILITRIKEMYVLKRCLLRVYLSGTKAFAGLGGPLRGGGGIAERLYFVVRITWYHRALSDKLRSLSSEWRLWMDPYNGTIDPVSMCPCPLRWTRWTLSIEWLRPLSIFWPGSSLYIYISPSNRTIKKMKAFTHRRQFV